MPNPNDAPDLREDEEPLEDEPHLADEGSSADAGRDEGEPPA
jgi:hypothetical protein